MEGGEGGRGTLSLPARLKLSVFLCQKGDGGRSCPNLWSNSIRISNEFCPISPDFGPNYYSAEFSGSQIPLPPPCLIRLWPYEVSSHFWRRIKVSKRLSGWFLQMINAQSCFHWGGGGGGSETPFWNAEKSAIWYAFEPETRFCRDDKRKDVLKRVYNYLRSTYVKAFLATRTRDRVRWLNATKITRETCFGRRLHTRFDSRYWNVFLTWERL